MAYKEPTTPKGYQGFKDNYARPEYSLDVYPEPYLPRRLPRKNPRSGTTGKLLGLRLGKSGA